MEGARIRPSLPWPPRKLTAMALRTAARRRRSARCHGRARGRGIRGRKLPPNEDSAPPEPRVAATTWGPRGEARALGAARVRAEPRAAHVGAGARPPPRRYERQREQGMVARPRSARGRRRARRRREEDGGRRSSPSPSPPRSLRGTEPRRARLGLVLLRYAAVGEGEGVGREGLAPSGVGPTPPPPQGPPSGPPCSSATTCALPAPLRRWPPVLGRGRCRPAWASSAMARAARSLSPCHRTEEKEQWGSSPPPSSCAPPAAPAPPLPRRAALCGSSASAPAALTLAAHSTAPAARSAAHPPPPRRPPTPLRADPAGESEHEEEKGARQWSTRGGQRPRLIGRGGPRRQSTLFRGVLDRSWT
ncbi:hypothetical protein PVAP13_8NG105104 [Panicum virgatum]|uniref:Uncharacterized protein n=1 Tax=Panicum virgatum TaxID=38727 RepID=A0A8T0PCX2_PANVG|nr:hypothetical protein PVAP13_8NG105104 [Panicum virgatum]